MKFFPNLRTKMRHRSLSRNLTQRAQRKKFRTTKNYPKHLKLLTKFHQDQKLKMPFRSKKSPKSQRKPDQLSCQILKRKSRKKQSLL